MKIPSLLAAATLVALASTAFAAPPCPAGATPGSADCPMGGPGGKRGAQMQERLKAADANNDGMISRDEAKALPRIAEQFDAIDDESSRLMRVARGDEAKVAAGQQIEQPPARRHRHIANMHLGFARTIAEKGFVQEQAQAAPIASQLFADPLVLLRLAVGAGAE